MARPLYARAASDNAASIRVLEKCGFTRVGVGVGSPTDATRRRRRSSSDSMHDLRTTP
jgi:RimJ/RimL family protein N-acetyltransferase